MSATEAMPLSWVLAAGEGSTPALLAALAVATLLSEDLACVAAGLLVASGRLPFAGAAAACAGGILGGDLALVGGGRLLAALGLRRLLVRLVGAQRLAAGEEWARRHGPAAAIAGRFLPGTRTATFLALGALLSPSHGARATGGGVAWLRLLAAFTLAVALWTPALVALAALAGTAALPLLARLRWLSIPAGVLLVALLWAGSRALPRAAARLLPWRRRRVLLGAWRRWTRWEHWPPWLFYPPLAGALGWLALRHRSLTLWTAANPGLGGGGFVGESKAEALAALPPAAVARFRLLPAALPAAARLEAARAFAAAHALELPLVVKPDVGQRGEAVTVAATWQQVAAALASIPGDALVQEHAPGVELGALWVGLAGEPRGTLLSLTETLLPSVVGDGERTLEELVLADARAVAVAPLHLRRLGADAARVPAAGEMVALAGVGNGCRGAELRDGAAHATPALADAVEGLARAVPGFCIGRFDLEAPSWEHFRRGEAIRVREVHGVAFEAAHVSDARYGVLHAWRTLYRQWALAFEAGRRNRARGARPLGARGLVALLLAARRRRG